MISVIDIMTKGVKKVSQDAQFGEIWSLIFKKKINAVIVVDAKDKMVGILTKEDMLKTLYPDYAEYIEDLSAGDMSVSDKAFKDILKMKAKNVMHRNVIFTRSDTPIMRALARMIARRVNQLPVVNDQMKLIGIITKGDIFYSLYRSHRTVMGTQERETKKTEKKVAKKSPTKKK